MTEIETPFDRFRSRVKPEWVDYNNHFNMGYYLVAFDLASEELSDAAGFTAETRAATGLTIYVLETHVIYRREVKPDESFRITTQLLGADKKRLHLWQALYTDGNSDPAAFNETMMLCVNQKNPKAAPWPEPVHEAFQAIANAHARLPYPADAGRCVRRIGIAGL